MDSVFITGLGDIGEHILELLVRVPNVPKIYVGDIKKEESLRKIYSARSGAIHQGFYPKIEFIHLDVNDVERTAGIIQEINPEVIVSSMTLKTWWALEAELPPEVFRRLDKAGFGPWLPWHLTLVYKLMQAVKKSGVEAHVINASFPDAVNVILGKVGLAPAIGLGNCDLFVPELRRIVADKFNVSVKSVSVYLVGHHYLAHALNAYQSTMGCPYYLKIMIDDKDVTKQFNLEKLLVEANKYMPKGVNDHFIVAASGVKNLLAILYDTKELTYSPGPQGLPGGYPVRLSRKGAEVYLPEDITFEDAVRINEEAQKLDGIEEIKDDGTVVLTEKAVTIMEELMGYKYKELKLSECEEKARELLFAYKQLVEKYKRH
ncbi:hypothetical protein [Thermococcus sibiricus]|uniref:Saccharopine dehydrogenase NADP binding domain-containing protein n=1 Tax=Thermococcus sibiricus TaxID=172049 RepID=A0A101EMC5_9EURY|nr:hypothetical protein [Thermococcus sibiricus]KUK18029.1 MAG: Uncharacterized protein XD54_0645 [Thermococcus sibiricus]